MWLQVWLLRDFQLELKDEADRPLTPTQYLEECLRAQPGASAAVAEQNATRAVRRATRPHRPHRRPAPPAPPARTARPRPICPETPG